MKRIVIALLLLAATFIFITYVDYRVPFVHSKAVQTSLSLVAENSPGPGLNVYIYRYNDGWGGYYHFVVAERNYKDGVSVTQLK